MNRTNMKISTVKYNFVSCLATNVHTFVNTKYFKRVFEDMHTIATSIPGVS